MLRLNELVGSAGAAGVEMGGAVNGSYVVVSGMMGMGMGMEMGMGAEDVREEEGAGKKEGDDDEMASLFGMCVCTGVEWKMRRDGVVV